MAALRNPRHEEFAQHIALGWPKYKAYEAVYGKQSKAILAHTSASRLWGHLQSSAKIRRRVEELRKARRKSAELTQERLLDDLVMTVDLANAAGQHSAAITGIKALGSEMFSMFTERRETVNIDLQITSEAQLKAELIKDYGEKTANAILATWNNKHRLIKHDAVDAEMTTDSPNNRGLCHDTKEPIEPTNLQHVGDITLSHK